MNSTPPLQIIALGSPFGADHIAWSALECLQESGFGQHFPMGAVLMQPCPSPAQLPPMIRPGVKLVILDALEGAGEGEVRRLSLGDLVSARQSAGSHGLGLDTILPLIETLGTVMGDPVIIGVGMGPASSGTSPSDEAMMQLTARLAQLVELSVE